MKRKIIFLLILISIFEIFVLFNNRMIVKNQNKIMSSNKGELAILLFDSSINDYVEHDSIPIGNYSLDNKTYCIGGSKVTSYDNTTGKVSIRYSGFDDCFLYFYPITPLNQKIISLLSDKSYTSSQNGTEYKVKYFDKDKTYRFAGDSPDNYVLFNDQLWFAMSSVNGSELGLDTNTYYSKLLLVNSIGKYAWNAAGDDYINTTWTGSTLQQILNGDYYNRTGDFINSGIMEKYHNYIVGTQTKVVQKSFNYYNSFSPEPLNFYDTFEIDTNYTYVKLINVSDLMYSRLNFEETYTEPNYETYGPSYISSSSPGYEKTITVNPGMDAYHITDIDNDPYFGFDANCEAGGMSSVNAWSLSHIRPVIYLKPEVNIVSGTGKKNDPYVLNMSY